MGKTKTPFFSMGSRGTVADTLTSQKRGSQTLIREKPTPIYTRTLAQNYQRWDYQDQAYLWTLLSEAEKRTYHTAASRYHMTGFAYWMRVRLNTLPDLCMRLHLDEPAGNIAYDSSKQGNNGTIFGTTSAPGVINRCREFDGLDDRIECGVGVRPTAAISILLFVKPLSFTDYKPFITCLDWPAPKEGYSFRLMADQTFMWRVVLTTDNGYNIQSAETLTQDTWQHIALTHDANFTRLYLQGDMIKEESPGGTIIYVSSILRVGASKPIWARFLRAQMDELIVDNRVLDDTEIKRHSERRYPL